MATTAAIIGFVGIIVSAAVSAYAAYASSEAQAQAADYNKKVAKNQQVMSRQAAELEVENRRRLYARQQSAQRAAIGASGLEGSEGSPLLVQMDSAAEAQKDLERVRYAGEVRATGYGAEAKLQKFYARTARKAGYVGVGTSLLAGAASAYAAYSGIPKTGGYGVPAQ